jgi:hypothetical protein
VVTKPPQKPPEPPAPDGPPAGVEPGEPRSVRDEIRSVLGEMFGSGELEVEEERTEDGPSEKPATLREIEERTRRIVSEGIADLKRRQPPEPEKGEKKEPEHQPDPGRRIERWLWGGRS